MTAQQQWKIRNGKVKLDKFDTGEQKVNVPVNRHRIPKVYDDIIDKVKKAKPVVHLKPNESLVWDMDGRRHV